MTVNAKTRNRSNRKRYQAEQARKRRPNTDDQAFAEYARDERNMPRAGSSRLYRMTANPDMGGQTEIHAHLLGNKAEPGTQKGYRLAKRSRGDVMGPISRAEYVGCTVQRDSVLDYLSNTGL